MWRQVETHLVLLRVEDKEQVRNLYTDEARKQVVAELTERIAAHHRAVKTPSAEWLLALGGGAGR